MTFSNIIQVLNHLQKTGKISAASCSQRKSLISMGAGNQAVIDLYRKGFYKTDEASNKYIVN